MQVFRITKGKTSAILPISIFDSSSTTGAKLAGLVFNTASLTAYYNRSGAAGAAVAITLATATKGTWATGGFIAIDGTNMPGDYELHIPDAALATGADTVMVQLKGAANMVPKNILIELSAVDLQNATTAGLANLDAAVSGRMATYTQPTGFLSATFPDGTVANTTNITAGTITTATAVTTVNGIAANVITAAATATDFGTEIAAAVWDRDATLSQTQGTFGQAIGDPAADTDTIWSLANTNLDAAVSTRMATYVQPTGFLAATFPAGTVANTTNVTAATGIVLSGVTHTGAVIPTVSVLTGHTAQTGDSFARLGAPAGASVSADVAAVKTDTAAVKAKTDSLTFTVAGQVDANALAVNGIATAAARLARSTQGIVLGTVGAASTTTSIVTSALDPAAADIDQYKGRIVTFGQGTTTANLRGQSTDITSNTALGVLTVSALTTAPVSADTFTIT